MIIKIIISQLIIIRISKIINNKIIIIIISQLIIINKTINKIIKNKFKGYYKILMNNSNKYNQLNNPLILYKIKKQLKNNHSKKYYKT